MAKKLIAIQYETCCVDATAERLEELCKGARPCSYKNLERLIKRYHPEMAGELTLKYYNPFAEQSKQTKTHYIYVHSAIEYIFKKIFA